MQPPLHLTSQDDLSLVAQMAREIWPRTYRTIISAEQIRYMLDSMYSVEKMTAEVKSGEAVYCWIMHDSSRVGFTAFGPLRASHPCEIHKLYLLPDSRGQGCGRSAVSSIKSAAGEAGASHLRLRVNRRNTPAIAFYEACGFTRHSCDCKEIGGGFVMDDYILQKPLNDGTVISS